MGSKVKAFLNERYIIPIPFSIYKAGYSIKKENERSQTLLLLFMDELTIFQCSLLIWEPKGLYTHAKTVFCLKGKAAQIVYVISLLDR